MPSKIKKKMKTRITLLIALFFMLLPIVLSCADDKKDDQNFSLLYLFQRGYSDNKTFSIFTGNRMLAELENLKNRNILELHFDREYADSVLFAEKAENVYRIIRLNYITNEEKVLFDFEKEIYRFSTFTKDSFFWCERCEKNREPHILYEYNSKTKKINKLFEVEDILDKHGERYESRFITAVQAEDNTVYFYMDGGFVGDSGSFVIDRSTGDVRKNAIDIGWSYPCSRYKNKIIREGSSVTQTENMKYFRSDSKSCVITDLNTFEDIQCTFKQRYERMAGPLVLLSDDYFLVPLCISPFKDSLRNGLFGKNWTVCYRVFDIKKNKTVFNGIGTETDIMRLADAVLIN